MINAWLPVTATAISRVPARKALFGAFFPKSRTLMLGPKEPSALSGGKRFTTTACELSAVIPKALGESPTGILAMGWEELEVCAAAKHAHSTKVAKEKRLIENI